LRETPIGESKRQAATEADELVTQCQKAIDKIATDHDEKIQALNRERDTLVKQSNAEVWRKIIEDNEVITANRKKLMDLDQQERPLQAQEDKLEQAKCLGCSKKKKKELIKVKADISNLETQRAAIKKSIDDSSDSEKKYDEATAKLDAFKVKLAAKDKAINDEIDANKTADAAAQIKLKSAKQQQQDLHEEITEAEIEFCRNIDRNTMFDLVHLRVRVDYFFSVVKTSAEGLRSESGVLDVINGKMFNLIQVLDAQLKGLSCDKSGNHSALRIYQDYLRLIKVKPEVKTKMETSVYSPDGLLDTIVPERKPSTVALPVPTIDDLNTFFPSTGSDAGSPLAVRAASVSASGASTASSSVVSPRPTI
jgi:hypothetical protein